MNLFTPKQIATFFGVGLAKNAPGTVGSLATLPLAAFLQYFGGPVFMLFAAALVLALGCHMSDVYAREIGQEDPGEIVIDEVAGQLLALSFVPLTLMGYVLAFALFRFFDVVKPWPISLADRKLKGGFGIMADDALAGLFALISYALIMALWTTLTLPG